MTRGTALITSIADVVRLTQQTGLANIEADGEIDVPTALITASDTIYDKLEVDGIDPTDLSNSVVFERAVAWRFLATLGALGFFSAGEGERSQEFYDRFMTLSEKCYVEVLAKVTDKAKRPTEGIPVVRNTRTEAYF